MSRDVAFHKTIFPFQDISSNSTPSPVVPLPIEDHSHFDYAPTEPNLLPNPDMVQTQPPPIHKTYQCRHKLHHEPSEPHVDPSPSTQINESKIYSFTRCTPR